MTKKRTHEEFLSKVYDLVGEEYDVLSKYVDSHTNVQFKHNKCGNIYYTKPYIFLGGSKCPVCAEKERIEKCKKIRSKTHEQFIKEVYKQINDEYTILGKYIGTDKKLVIQHNKCGYRWEVRPHDFLSGSRCPKCGREQATKKVTRTHEEFIKIVFDLIGIEYEVLGIYKDSHTKILMRHNVCKYEYEVEPHSFLKGHRCPKCSGRMAYTTESFKEKVFEIIGDEYSVLGEYKDSSIKILMRHNLCGCEWNVLPSTFISTGSRCPDCNGSKGEKIIRNYLENIRINFKPQYTIDNLRNIRLLRFDFCILDINYNLLGLIEYQGIQHYEPVERFGGEEGLRKCKINDNIKYNYCIGNNIPLLYIPYWEIDNIENILDEWLLNYEDVKNTSSFNLSN